MLMASFGPGPKGLSLVIWKDPLRVHELSSAIRKSSMTESVRRERVIRYLLGVKVIRYYPIKFDQRFLA
jgi:hypothetical protein